MKKISTKTLAVTALFIALSFIGSGIKIFGTIAFDSLPGFLSALVLGPGYGAVIGFLGHLSTALTSGFPLSIPMHLVISLSMSLTMLGFGFTYKALQNKIPEKGSLAITGAVGIILNAPASLALSMGAMTIIAGKEAALGLLVMLPFLISASAANVAISLFIFKSLESVWRRIL